MAAVDFSFEVAQIYDHEFSRVLMTPVRDLLHASLHRVRNVDSPVVRYESSILQEKRAVVEAAAATVQLFYKTI